MSEVNTRKRRVDARPHLFKFYNCADVMMNIDGKVFVYEPVIMRLAKELASYSQPVYSLYRDIHRAKSARDIHGVRAIDIDGFNAENYLCKISVSALKGKSVLVSE